MAFGAISYLGERLLVLCYGNGKVFEYDLVDGFTVSKLQSRPADFRSVEPIVLLVLQVSASLFAAVR